MEQLLIYIGPVLGLLFLFYQVGYDRGQNVKSKTMEAYVEIRVSGEKNKLLIKGEQVGYEKGFEAGKLEARQELRNEFVSFLEGQLRVLKNQLPAPIEDEDEIYIIDK